MKRLFYALSLMGMLGVLPAPTPADALIEDCLNEAINSCSADFPGDADRAVGIRGWCYLIRWSWCEAFDR